MTRREQLLVRLSLTLTLIGLPLLAGPVLAQPVEPDASPTRPNIVVIYMDDFSTHPTWLWSKASRTPALAKFVKNGVHFKNAIGSTPRCCPARANVLTARYGHNNGVTKNDPSDVDLHDALNKKLKAAGYQTALVGKYFNGIADLTPNRASMARYARGWDTFDIVWKNQGAWYDYPLYTKSKTLRYGSAPRDHSSEVMARRAARHIKRAPADKPLFMIVSLFDGHDPITPMPRLRGHPACARVKPYSSPAFNEANVSDKPRYIRRTRKLRRNQYGLVKRCEAVMTVDRVTSRVRSALRKSGRLDDTLLVFAADNGWMLGDHRVVRKGTPYSTPVPLYMLWPSELGNVKRVVEEPVSNVDFGSTFCELAGCALPASDGMSLLPLLRGETDRLDRKFVYEEMLHTFVPTGMPAWYGIRTTKAYSDTLWVYTEYKGGERELYDLTRDPHQLVNLAGRPKHAAVQKELKRLLHRGVIKPDGVRFLAPIYDLNKS